MGSVLQLHLNSCANTYIMVARRLRHTFFEKFAFTQMLKWNRLTIDVRLFF